MAHLQLARGLAKLGRRLEADAALANCEAKFGRQPDIEIAKANMAKDVGDLPAAHAILEKAAETFPAHFELLRQRVAMLVTLGRFEEARGALEAVSALSVRENAQLRLLWGRLAFAQWDLDEACDNFEAGLKFEVADAGSYDVAAKAALLRLDLEAAERHLAGSVRNNVSHRIRHCGSSKPTQTLLGQLLDEYRIDRVALESLRRRRAAPAPIPALAELVMRTPDYTPAAIGFLVELRRARLLSARPAPGGANARSIPETITQFWDENIPADVEARCETWRKAHPSYAYARFSKLDARRFLFEEAPRGALAAFDRAREPAMKADIFRLAHLFVQRGYYADADDRCLAPLSTIDPGTCDLLLFQDDHGEAANNFIGVSAGHPAIGQALKAAIEAVNRGDADMVWLSTGPGLMTRSVAFYLAERLEERLATTVILDRHEVAQAVAIHCPASYKQMRRHWTRAVFKG